MPYTTGTQGADANCAKTFMEGVLHTALTGAGFTYVEEVASSNIRARIYKSPAGSNFFGQDWYLLVYRGSDGAGSIQLGVMEQYNSSTHLCFNYAPTTTNLTPTAQYAVNDATGQNPATGTMARLGTNVNTSGFQYWLSVTANRIVFATRVGVTDAATYAGLYDDLLNPVISPFPLVVSQMGEYSMSSSSNGSATREPGQTAASTYNFFAYPCGTYNLTWTPLRYDNYQSRYMLSRLHTHSARVASGFRGLYRDYWATGMGGVNGDTISATINGVATTLVRMSGQSTGHNGAVDTAI